jgi:hypothetical protein
MIIELVLMIPRSTGLDSKNRWPRNGAALNQGAVAQLGERLICIQEVAGSIPTSSTSLAKRTVGYQRCARFRNGPVAQVARARP